ncbi:MAG: tetraacyldisaccharide 4'-kinase [Nitrospirae bacterium]|nr:tetraacyldisaccharide 4'-kinase [Nitrospirota bacterium]MBI5694804.1 tetraacyldisaccharide 4'-kinase [Nitrospirota bacterium]
MKISPHIAEILKGVSPLPLYYFVLYPFSLAYSLVMTARAWLYMSGLLRRRRLPCKVVSVGNITSGGTGKTPMVTHIVRRLSSKGRKVTIVTRGYGGSMEGGTAVVSDGENILLNTEQAGDEAVLLAKGLPGVPVVMGGDRYDAGMLAVRRFNPDVVILDDAFQRLDIMRDLDVLLLDAGNPFGNGYTLPMGYLREPRRAAGRADIAVLTRADEGNLNSGMAKVAGVAPGLPVAGAEHRAESLKSLLDGKELGLSWLSGKRVIAVSGIANPASFALILNGLNAKIAGNIDFSDHHAYRADDIETIDALVESAGAEVAVTTEKDAVKLSGLMPGRARVLVLGIELVITVRSEIFDDALEELYA